MKLKSLSRVRLLATSWTAAYQAPPSMGFSRQEYWSGVPLPSLSEDLWQPLKKETAHSASGELTLIFETPEPSLAQLTFVFVSHFSKYECLSGLQNVMCIQLFIHSTKVLP